MSRSTSIARGQVLESKDGGTCKLSDACGRVLCKQSVIRWGAKKTAVPAKTTLMFGYVSGGAAIVVR